MTALSLALGLDVPTSTVGNNGACWCTRGPLGKPLTRIDSSYSRKLEREMGPYDSISGGTLRAVARGEAVMRSGHGKQRPSGSLS